MEYELINLSDPYTFVATDREVAALVVGCFGTAYGADTKDEDREQSVPIFLLGGIADYNTWYVETFGRTPTEGLDVRKREVAEALLSMMLGRFEDRRKYEAALTAIDDPAKKEKFIADWQDGRTSLNDIGTAAHIVGKKLMEECAKDGN